MANKQRNTLKHSQAPVRSGTQAVLQREVQRLRDHIYGLYIATCRDNKDPHQVCFDPDCDGLCAMDEDAAFHPNLKEPITGPDGMNL